MGVNTLAYLAQHLIVLLDPADIVINIHHAYRAPGIRPIIDYARFHTGPSATADIEGVLIHGAQGVAFAVYSSTTAWVRAWLRRDR